MVRLYLSITEAQREELKEHLELNGYAVEWEKNGVILVDEDEIAYVKTILHDRMIGFAE